MMEMKRYSNEELSKLLKDMFFDYYSTNSVTYELAEVKKNQYSDKNIFEDIYLENKDFKETLEKEIKEMESVKKKTNSKSLNADLEDALCTFKKVVETMETPDAKLYGKLMASTEARIYAEPCVKVLELPLNKKINSLYDGFTARYMLFNTFTNKKEKIDEFNSLETKEEKIAFLKKNVEFYNVSLGILSNSNALNYSIVVEGEYNDGVRTLSDSSNTTLPKDYSDLRNLTLEKIGKIKNNDIAQLLQSLIDIDKENLKVVADLDIGEGEYADNYKILEQVDDNEDVVHYIRYVCPSTQRVYFNKINEGNLRPCNLFKKGDYNSYIYAWWKVTHLGEDPTTCGEVYRC